MRGVVLSTTKNSDSYRSAFIGLYTSLAMASAVNKLYEVRDGKLNANCNSKQAIYLSLILKQRVAISNQHSEILQDI